MAKPAPLILAAILASLLPSIAIGAGAASWHLLADALPYAGIVDELANKNIGYWFLALAGIAIASWTWIVKWLIKQLDAQRGSNADITSKLIGYMEKDHSDMRAVLGQTNEVLRRVLEKFHP